MGRDMPDAGRVVVSGNGNELKVSWPEVVGMAGILAVTKIRRDRPDVKIEGRFVGENVPPGYDPERVCIFVNDDAVFSVAQTPIVG